MPESPTSRSLALLRKEGYTAAVVEHWNPHARIRQDLFGVIDVVGLGDGEIIGVQATSDSHVAERVRKIAEHENTPAIRQSGMRLEVWGWRKVKGRWQCRRVDVS